MNALTEAVIRATDKAIKYDAALLEIAKHLSPSNKNVTDGDLIACVRDLAQIARGHEDMTHGDLRTAWEAGFWLCRSYGDNYAYFSGEQKERQWQAFLAAKAEGR